MGTWVRGHCIVCMAETLCHLLTCHRLPCLARVLLSLCQQFRAAAVLSAGTTYSFIIDKKHNQGNEWMADWANEWMSRPLPPAPSLHLSPFCLHWELRNCCASWAELMAGFALFAPPLTPFLPSRLPSPLLLFLYCLGAMRVWVTPFGNCF